LRFLLANVNDFEVENQIPNNNLLELDKWILNQVSGLQESVKDSYKKFEYHLVTQKIHNFCVNELGGIYLDIIKDR